MRKITPIVIGVFFLIIVALLVFYFKPANSQDNVSNVQKENHSNTYSNGQKTDSLNNSATDSNSAKSNIGGVDREMGALDDVSAQNGATVDFNEKVYGSVIERVDGNQASGQNQSAGTKSANGLYNTQSDLTIKPVDPAKDPGNQVASFDNP